MPSGFVGVDVFFVISGYVITHSVIERWARSGTFSFKDFWGRRARRLVPALGLMVGVVSLGAILFLAISPAAQSALTGLLAMLSLANVGAYRLTGDYFSLDASLNALIHTWSLAVEEQYYLGFSVLVAAIVAGRLRSKLPQVALALFSGLFAVSLLAAFVGYTDVIDGWLADFLLGFYSPIPRLWEFSVGVLGYLLVRNRGRLAGTPALVAFALGFALMVVGASGSVGFGVAPFSSEVGAAVLGAFLVLISDSRSISRLALENPLMVWLGNRSYSVYLWHWPMIVFSGQIFASFGLAGPIGAIVSIPIAMLSYRLVEQKQLALTFSDWKAARVFLLKFVLTPILVAGGTLLALYIAGKTLEQPEVSVSIEPCTNISQSDQFEVCKWNTDAPNASTVWLVGDSNANHYRTGLHAAVFEQQSEFGVSVRNGCPPLTPLPASTSFPDGCERNNELVFDYLTQQDPGIIVMGMSVRRWLDDVAPDGGARYVSSLEASIVKLHSAGHRVVVVSPLPPWPDTSRVGPNFCGIALLLQDRCVVSLDLANTDPNYHLLVDALEDRVIELGADWLDLRSEICPQETCLSRGPDGVWIWSDRSHISRATSERLMPIFLGLLQEAQHGDVPASSKPS